MTSYRFAGNLLPHFPTKDNPTLSACIKICRATAAVSSQASEMKAAMSSMVKPEPVDNGYDSTSSRLSLVERRI